jgi:NAD(P)-dependent dehydrogenase (short-subunit alcohol dehydrogenase family)
MRIVITGASGTIGTALLRRLSMRDERASRELGWSPTVDAMTVLREGAPGCATPAPTGSHESPVDVRAQ